MEVEYSETQFRQCGMKILRLMGDETSEMSAHKSAMFCTDLMGNLLGSSLITMMKLVPGMPEKEALEEIAQAFDNYRDHTLKNMQSIFQKVDEK